MVWLISSPNLIKPCLRHHVWLICDSFSACFPRENRTEDTTMNFPHSLVCLAGSLLACLTHPTAKLGLKLTL